MDDAHVLVVDDHRDIRDPLAAYLKRHDLRVSVAADAAVARAVLAGSAIDLVILDVMMPGEDGLSLCRHIREVHDTPVILLTALAERTDRIVGLEIGADDYVTKPFDPRELLARIKNLLRRTRALPRTRDEADGRRLAFDRWTLDTDRRELVDEAGAAVALSTAEFRLLAALTRHPRVVLSRDQLLDLTSGRAADGFDRSIDNQVSRLRRKLERDPANPALLKTVWGGGYVLAAEVRTLP
ncbi:response regulator [Methylobacterium sp.]|jgi:two-component system OmpR family response regulator|uniref:response regulator n=1 Tax=Methylobacterium sp. TaxID=409 RepID=UPI00260D8277|nr:response regulator [Methylobacterium sp.]MDB5647886.1 Two-component system response regulator [Methylobacterium sp.]